MRPQHRPGHWERFENNLSRNPESVLGGIWEAWPKQPENPDLNGNTWAPDVIWNPVMGKWCMYLSVNGHDFRSVIVLLTADRLDGDWTYVGPVVYSGFDASNVDRTDVPRVLGEQAAHDLPDRYLSLKDTRINAIDAAPILCEHGEMWMSVGSWFGGIWMFRLDPTTGLRDYTAAYPFVKDACDPYYGVKAAGGYWNSGEGSYFVRKNGWWYLFLSYGWLGTTGGYQIRIFRSKHLLGPYVDQNGNPAICAGEIPDNLTKDTGVRLTSSVLWSGGPDRIGSVEVSQGHNSVLHRRSDGRLFLTYHTRFIEREGEDYETHIRELLPTEDGWLVAAPYEYQGQVATPPTPSEPVAPTPAVGRRARPLDGEGRASVMAVRRLRAGPARPAHVLQRRARCRRRVRRHQPAGDDHAAAGRPGDQRRCGLVLRYPGGEPATVDRRPGRARHLADAGRLRSRRRALLRHGHGDHARRRDLHRRVRGTPPRDRRPHDADLLRDRRQPNHLGRAPGIAESRAAASVRIVSTRPACTDSDAS